MSFGEGTGLDFATIRGRDYPTIRQFTVFLENRVGQLLEVVRRFEGSKVRIVALSIIPIGFETLRHRREARTEAITTDRIG